VRLCVWSRNIKNRRSIYIFDISSLRVNYITLILLRGENGELIMPANSRWDLIQRLKG